MLVLALLSASCAAGEQADRPLLQSDTAPSSPETTTTAPVETVDIGPDRAELLLAELTLEEKVGQLFMPEVWGTGPSTVSQNDGDLNEARYGVRTPAEIVARYHLGGVIYFEHNVVTADQVSSFSTGLQDVANGDSGVGLLIAVDQEGGRVNRITDGVTVFPPAFVLAGDAGAVWEAGYLTGQQVRGQGINVVLAPVADLSSADSSGAIGSRSYGQDPVLVSDMVRAAVGGIQRSGVAAAVKHWPGHGPTGVDSHDRLPVLDISQTAWESRERAPFEAAIDEGVAIVLVGHLALPAVDPAEAPATVSPVLIDQQLRGVLGFDGVVMTDALNMGAVSNISQADLVIGAVGAGADILLMPDDLPTALNAVTDAVRRGDLTMAQLDAAVLRVLRLKQQLGLLPAS